MPSTTPTLALPYPVPADSVDVPRDVKALADKLDTFTGVKPPPAAALPAAPVDGQECLFSVPGWGQAPIGLRYVGSVGRWLNISGGELVYGMGQSDFTPATAFTAVQLSAVTAALPAGDWLNSFFGQLSQVTAVAGPFLSGVSVGSVAATSEDVVKTSYAMYRGADFWSVTMSTYAVVAAGVVPKVFGLTGVTGVTMRVNPGALVRFKPVWLNP